MADLSGIFDTVWRFISRHRGIILPTAVAGMIFVILVPLPPAVIDLLLAANIALAALILLTTLYISSPLDFSVFPSVLLVTTLFRLVLNIATTRLILTAGADGAAAIDAQFAAGRVIWSFSRFVTSGSLAIGVILFVMLIVIQFVVITKGAARVSEVAARFVLDAMPGKQMAIDADLTAGLIDQAAALRRRNRIAAEADFYGSMDGASKFLRGDAVAAAVISLVNILGGLYIGMVNYGWSWSQTAWLFTQLTIGDGLVTQIPAMLICVSAGLIVTRSTARTNLGEDMIGQLIARPVVLVITGVFLALLTLTSLPTLPLLTLAVGCTALAAVIVRRRRPAARATAPGANASGPPAQRIDDLLRIEAMRIELGYSLVPLVDSDSGGVLLERIASVRRQIAEELGLVVPPIKICDDMRLDANTYVIRIHGVKIACEKLFRRKLLAVGANGVAPAIGQETAEAAFGTPAAWIEPARRAEAEAMGYTVVEADVALTTHLGEIIRRHAAELLSRQQVVRLLENLRPSAEHIVAEALETRGVAKIQKVLQNLLRERAPIRDLETILEAMCEAGLESDEADLLTEHVRSTLWRAISQQYRDEDGKMWGVCLEPALDEQVGQYVSESGRTVTGAVPIELEKKITRSLQDGLAQIREQGRKPVVLCSPQVRPTIRQMLSATTPETAVLAFSEVDCADVKSVTTAGMER